MIPTDIIEVIEEERDIQETKWGGDDHDDKHTSHDWVAIIVRHLGKSVMWPFRINVFRYQMVRIAAIAVAAIEWCDRLSEPWKERG